MHVPCNLDLGLPRSLCEVTNTMEAASPSPTDGFAIQVIVPYRLPRRRSRTTLSVSLCWRTGVPDMGDARVDTCPSAAPPSHELPRSWPYPESVGIAQPKIAGVIQGNLQPRVAFSDSGFLIRSILLPDMTSWIRLD